MTIAIAHRAPADPARCAALAAAGASIFEIDVQTFAHELISSHFLPVHPRLSRVRRDRRSFTVRRRAGVEIALDRAISAVPGGAQLLLDLKCDVGQPAADLVDRLIDAGLDRDRCVVSTKGWHTLPALRAGGFGTWRTVADGARLAEVLSGPPLSDDAVTVRHSLLTHEVVARLREKVPTVMCWTVNDPRRAEQLVAAGVDGITSDSIDVVRLVAEN
ncbi:MAG: glycerophosphodiester phosphodiesterase [Sporichthyaceae bacterium]